MKLITISTAVMFLLCGLGNMSAEALDRNLSDGRICDLATAKASKLFGTKRWSTYVLAVEEAKRRGLGCGVVQSAAEKREAKRVAAEEKAAKEKARRQAALELKELERKKKAFNKCMFENIKPSSNAAHRRIVKNYCNDQAEE